VPELGGVNGDEDSGAIVDWGPKSTTMAPFPTSSYGIQGKKRKGKNGTATAGHLTLVGVRIPWESQGYRRWREEKYVLPGRACARPFILAPSRLSLHNRAGLYRRFAIESQVTLGCKGDPPVSDPARLSGRSGASR
jgi:hypothetical protein